MGDPKRAVTQFKVEFETDGDENEALTTHFSTMQIINSTRSIWPIFNIWFHVDNQIFIEKNIYGMTDIVCKIKYTEDNGEDAANHVKFTLIYLESAISLPPKIEENVPLEDAREVNKMYVLVTCIAKPAYLSMSTFINKLWEEPTEMTPLDMIKKLLVDNEIPNRVFDDGFNDNKIQQMLIPPMTFKGAVDYINQSHGIFSGPLFRYCNYSGEFQMWDLRKMFELKKDSPWVKFHKSPSAFTTPGLFEKINEIAYNTDDEFVTYVGAETIHHANANVIKYGYENIYIYHPHEDIALFQKKTLDEIIPDYGIWHDSDELKFHPDLRQRSMYFYDMKGFETGDGYTGEYSNHILTQDMATSFQNASAVRLKLFKNVKLPMVMKVGEVLYLKPYSDFEKYPGSNYEGGYLITDSMVVITRIMKKEEININCTATLTAVRTTQSKN